jgi:hypothetical protein
MNLLLMPSYVIFLCECLVWVIMTSVILMQPKVPQAIPWLRAIATGLSSGGPVMIPGQSVWDLWWM